MEIQVFYDQDMIETSNMSIEEYKKYLNTLKENEIKIKEKPIHFLRMNNTLNNIFKTLCKVHVAYNKYEQIPPKILEIIENNKGNFDYFEIWYNDTVKDPILVGYTNVKWKIVENWQTIKTFNNKEEAEEYAKSNRKLKVEPNLWDAVKYILARWGDEKKDLKILANEAKQKYIIEKSLELKRTIKEAETKLDLLQEEAELMFSI